MKAPRVSQEETFLKTLFNEAEKQVNDRILARLRESRQRKRELTGRCEGAKAFGSSADHRPTIERIVTLRASGMALDKIAEMLNAEGLKSKNGGKWWGTAVSNVLVRETDYSTLWVRRKKLNA